MPLSLSVAVIIALLYATVVGCLEIGLCGSQCMLG